MTSDTLSKTPLAFGLWRYALIGAVIAFAGPPIYIHTPKVYGELQSLDLGVMASILVALRLFDFIQDPALGWLITKFQKRAQTLVMGFAALFGIGMLCLFTPEPLLALPIWFAMSLALVFTGFSGLQIIFYSTGLEMAESSGESHARIAAWREASVLIGISAACVAPVILASQFGDKGGYWAYSLLFLGVLVIAMAFSRPVWQFASTQLTDASRFWHLLKNPNLRWLMGIGFLNSLPTGITSTLFLFYVEDRLGTEIHAGPMLLLFFLSAAVAAPLWGYLAARQSAKRVLMIGMILVAPAFILAAFLGTGDIWQFYVICILSGIALGADMTLLPALLSDELSRTGAGGSFTFGIWGFITKFSFAVGAGIALALIAMGGFVPGADNPESSLRALALTYAAVPCLLKLIAVIAVWIAPISRDAI